MGGGIILKDENGDVLVTLCCKLKGVCQPIVAELKALWRTMQLCDELNLQDVQNWKVMPEQIYKK